MWIYRLTPYKPSMIMALSLFVADAIHAQSVYRCPGPPPLYTDNLSPPDARKLQCIELSDIPLTIAQPRRRLQASTYSNTNKTASAPITTSDYPNNSNIRISSAEQKARDRDAKRILQEELAREELSLQELTRELNNGQPDRKANEKNYQRYLDRVAQMQDQLARKKADI